MVQRKTGRAIVLPIEPELAAEIAQVPKDRLTFLATAADRQFSVKGFGMRMRAWCKAAGLDGRSCHGLRKARATQLAEAGASAHEAAAVTGHASVSEVQTYTAAARQAALAQVAVKRVREGEP